MNLLQNLNPAQRDAVTHTGAPLLIVAGAGTGKTTVITRRIARLIEEKIATPEEILAITFTEKAAQEMEERVDQLLPYGYVDLWILTFHGFCQRVLTRHAIDIGLPADFNVMTQTEAWRLMRHNLERFDLDYYRPLGNPTKFLHALIQHFSRCKDEAITPEEYLAHADDKKLNNDSDSDELANLEAQRIREVARAYQTYQHILLENNALDFGDLIVQTLRLFRERPQILALYQKRFKEILVDEFQDTNWAQFELIKMLRPSPPAPSPLKEEGKTTSFPPSFSGKGEVGWGIKNSSALTVVGDDDQSIFAFRGASMSNILQFKQCYPHAQEIVLTENYRSKQSILDLSRTLINNNNPDRLEVRLGIDKQLVARREGEGVIAHLPFHTEYDEAVGVAKKIGELVRDNKATYGECAVLIRANAHAESFSQVFDEQEIPYQFLASRGLLRASVVLDIVAYLRLLDNYHESRALYRLLHHPFLGIAGNDLQDLVSVTRRKPWSLYRVVQQHQTIPNLAPETRKKLDQILQWIERHANLARRAPVTKVAYAFLSETGFLSWISGPSQNNVGGVEERRSQEQTGFVGQFYRYLEQFEKTEHESSVRHFLSELDLVLASGDTGSLASDPEAGPDVVKIFTVHGAKGLEFKYVFVVNMVEQRFPSMNRGEAIELPNALVKEIIPEGDIHLQEERRLLYVAMTRARDGLFFTSAEDYGGMRAKKPSRFLLELGLVTKEEKPIAKSRATLVREEVAPAPTTKTITAASHVYSYSQLKAYDTCPLQYKFSHIIHIPTPGKPVFVYGQIIHTTLQRFLNEMLVANGKQQTDLFASAPASVTNGGLPSLERLLQIYSDVWRDDWFEDQKQHDEYKKRGEQGLRRLWEQMNVAPPKVKYLEKDFTVRVGNYVLKGRIDRVDQKNNGIEIVDYKTGRAKSALEADDKQQLLMYQIAAEDPHVLHEKVEQLSYYYVDEGTTLSFVGSEKDIERLREWTAKTADNIQREDYTAHPGRHCQYCDYKDICEFAQL